MSDYQIDAVLQVCAELWTEKPSRDLKWKRKQSARKEHYYHFNFVALWSNFIYILSGHSREKS